MTILDPDKVVFFFFFFFFFFFYFFFFIYFKPVLLRYNYCAHSLVS